MNWKEIKENYPKAWEEFLKLLKDVGYIVHVDKSRDFGIQLCIYGTDGIYNIRDLYDFFDERKIEAYFQSNKVIYVTDGGEPYIYTNDGWVKRVRIITDLKIIDISKTRTQAEQILFEKCFSILEEQLKTNQDA